MASGFQCFGSTKDERRYEGLARCQAIVTHGENGCSNVSCGCRCWATALRPVFLGLIIHVSQALTDGLVKLLRSAVGHRGLKQRPER